MRLCIYTLVILKHFVFYHLSIFVMATNFLDVPICYCFANEHRLRSIHRLLNSVLINDMLTKHFVCINMYPLNPHAFGIEDPSLTG